MILEEAPD